MANALSPSAATLCSDCGIWLLKGSDRYCSLCGVCRIEVLRIYIDTAEPEKEAAGVFHLKNTREAQERFSFAECPPWLVADKGEVVLDGGKEGQVKLVAKPDELGGMFFQEGFVTLHDASGETVKEVKVEIWPWPEVVFSPLELIRGKIPEKLSLSVRVWPAPLEIRSLEIRSPEFDSLHLKFTGPLFLDLGEVSIPVAVDLPERIGPGTHTLSYQLSARGLRGHLSGELQLQLKEPPIIGIKEEGPLEVTLIPDDEETFFFTLLNRGGEPLEVRRIEIIPVQPASEEIISISVIGVQFPLKILRGEERVIDLRVSSAPSARPGEYTFRLRSHSNSLSELLVPVYVSVSDEEYSGLIAIDYGTTDSAAAHLTSQKGKGPLSPTNIPLEGEGQGDKIYSNIFFKGHELGREIPFIWCIGTEARVLGRSPGNRRRLVKAVKTKVGRDHREQIDLGGGRFELPAEEIVKFIHMDLLKRTRKALKQRPTSVLLSIPTRFTLRQKIMLRETFARALQAAGLEATVESVDESLAAGMFYIVIRGPREEKLGSKPCYTLMVIDFGGGTTDVTLFQVEQRLGENGIVEAIEQVKVLGAWGDEQMGGEDISWELALLLAERFLERKVDEQKDRDLIRELEDEAEAAKVAISALMTLSRQPQVNETLKEVVYTALRASLEHLLVKRGSLSDEELERIVRDYISDSTKKSLQVYSENYPDRSVLIAEEEVAGAFRKKLEALKAELLLLLARANLERVDVVLLAGQSSLFPLVEETFQELATIVDHVKDEKGELVLKECVSRGALLLRFLLGYHDFPIEGLNRLWACLGRITARPREGFVFKELIPWGFFYPGESKETFSLTSLEIQGRRARLKIEENMTLSNQPFTKPFCRYEWLLPDREEGEEYQCKLHVDEHGQVEAFCQIKGEWIKGQVVLEGQP